MTAASVETGVVNENHNILLRMPEFQELSPEIQELVIRLVSSPDDESVILSKKQRIMFIWETLDKMRRAKKQLKALSNGLSGELVFMTKQG